jgi:hypothetical protein
MFYDEFHESFEHQPGESETVWRYMDLLRYLSMLQHSALHFARADQMSDRWEGAYGDENIRRRPELYGEHFQRRAEDAEQVRNFVRTSIHLNCWHLAEYESAAMWDIYQREGRGVAVRSTWGLLTRSITTERHVFGGKVTYADYQKTFIPEDNIFGSFMYKRLSYSHEREVRFAMLTGVNGPDLRPEPEVIPVSVDLSRLVQAVYVAPDAPAWTQSVIEDATRRYGYAFDVRHSDLATDPVA